VCRAGQIRDDVVFERLVAKLPEGVSLKVPSFAIVCMSFAIVCMSFAIVCMSFAIVCMRARAPVYSRVQRFAMCVCVHAFSSWALAWTDVGCRW
jgi:hypothetical protein